MNTTKILYINLLVLLSFSLSAMQSAASECAGGNSVMNKQKFTIVQASDEHSAAEIAFVVNVAFSRPVWRREGAHRTNEQEVQEMIRHPHKKLYLCLADKKVCGTVLLDTSSSEAVVSLLAVHPAYQGNGVGELLMQHVEQEIRKMNKDSIYIRVIPVGQERLVAYYVRQGFIFADNIEKKLFDHPDLVKEEYWGKLFLHTMRKSLSVQKTKSI